METGALLAVDVMAATTHDASSIESSLELAEENLECTSTDDDDDDDDEGSGGGRHIEEVTADKGYHKASTTRSLKDKRVRTYIPERIQHGTRRWDRHGGRDTAVAVYDNRMRVARARGKALQRRRGELVERSFAHICETGQHRRVRLRGESNVRKRYLIQSAAYNLSLLMRAALGCGTPRELVDRLLALVAPCWTLIAWSFCRCRRLATRVDQLLRLPLPALTTTAPVGQTGTSTGC